MIMRKLHPGLAALAAAAMLAGCSQHDELVQDTDASTVNYSISVGLETLNPNSRADGEGSTNVTVGAVGDAGVTRLYYNAYYRDLSDVNTNDAIIEGDVSSGTDKVPVFERNKVVNLVNGQASINLSLPTGASYVVAFFAINPEAENVGIWKKNFDNGKDIDLRAVEVDYSKVESNNLLYMNAFSGHINVDHSSGNTNAQAKTVTLTRAVAQINVGADKEKWQSMVEANGGKAIYSKSKVTIKGLPNRLDILTGFTDLESRTDNPITFGSAPFMQPDESKEEMKWLTVPHTDIATQLVRTQYRWVSMTYILAGRRQDMTVDAEFEFTSEDGAKKNTIIATSLPVRRNYRTNILGRVLETSDQFDIVIDYKWQGNDRDLEIAADADHFLPLLKNDERKEICIDGTIDLTNATAEDLTLTTDKTIIMAEGSKIVLPGELYFQTERHNLTIEGGTITNIDEEGSPVAKDPTASTVRVAKALIHAKDANVTLRGVNLVNDPDHHWHGDGYNSSAFSYWGACDITIENTTIKSGEFALCGMGRDNNNSTVTATNSRFESTSANSNGTGNYAYCIRAYGKSGVFTNCEVKGVQGGFSGEVGDFTLIGGKYYTVNNPDKKDAFYAVYATNNSNIIIDGGEFYSPNKHNSLCEGTSCIVSGDNDTERPVGNIVIKSGRFSGKAYNHVQETVYQPEDYVAVTDDENPLIKWEIKAKSE